MSKHKCEIVFITCDTCGKREEVNLTLDETELPVGWMHIELSMNHRYDSACHHSGHNSFEFCGKACCKKKLMQTIGGDK